MKTVESMGKETEINNSRMKIEYSEKCQGYIFNIINAVVDVESLINRN